MFLTQKKKKEKIIQSFQLLGRLLAGGQTMLDAIRTMHGFFGMLYTYRIKYPTAFLKFEKYRFLDELWFHIQDGVAQGAMLSECIRNQKLIDSNIVERVAKGENNGNLPVRLLQIDRNEIDADGVEVGGISEESSDVVRIVNKIIENASKLKARKIALPSLPNGESPFEPEPVETQKNVADDFPMIQEDVDPETASMDNFTVYFLMEGKWHLYYKLPGCLLSRILNRLLLMSGVSYWTKTASEAVIKYRRYGADELQIKTNYFPGSQRVILTFDIKS